MILFNTMEHLYRTVNSAFKEYDRSLQGKISHMAARSVKSKFHVFSATSLVKFLAVEKLLFIHVEHRKVLDKGIGVSAFDAICRSALQCVVSPY